MAKTQGVNFAVMLGTGSFGRTGTILQKNVNALEESRQKPK
jgi:hypothetical protein